jgi:predicted RNA-binding protein YlqC (UPF0109 family)
MDNSIDLQFVEYIVKSLVGNPDAVKITRTIDEKGVLLELTVDPEDLGRVIGKRGATAQSLRTLLRALGTKNDARYNLKIVDNGAPRPPREERATNDEGAQREDETPTMSDDAGAPDDDAWSVPAPAAPADDDAAEDDKHSDAISKARKDLADLDDLDI